MFFLTSNCLFFLISSEKLKPNYILGPLIYKVYYGICKFSNPKTKVNIVYFSNLQ